MLTLTRKGKIRKDGNIRNRQIEGLIALGLTHNGNTISWNGKEDGVKKEVPKGPANLIASFLGKTHKKKSVHKVRYGKRKNKKVQEKINKNVD
jgi:hypothetical protein